MQLGTFDEQFNKHIVKPVFDAKAKRKLLSDIESRVLVKDLPGNQKAALRRVK